MVSSERSISEAMIPSSERQVAELLAFNGLLFALVVGEAFCSVARGSRIVLSSRVIVRMGSTKTRRGVATIQRLFTVARLSFELSELTARNARKASFRLRDVSETEGTEHGISRYSVLPDTPYTFSAFPLIPSAS